MQILKEMVFLISNPKIRYVLLDYMYIVFVCKGNFNKMHD